MQNTEMEHERRIATLEGVAVETRRSLAQYLGPEVDLYVGVQHRNYCSCLCCFVCGHLPARLDMGLADELLQVATRRFQELGGNL